MYLDNWMEFIRVKILRRKPLTFERKCEAFERSRLLRDRYGRAKNVGEKITLRFKRWTGRFSSQNSTEVCNLRHLPTRRC